MLPESSVSGEKVYFVCIFFCPPRTLSLCREPWNDGGGLLFTKCCGLLRCLLEVSPGMVGEI